MKIGLQIKMRHGVLLDVMTQRGWSQTDLARYLGVCVTHIGGWFAMKRYPKKLTEVQVAKFANIDSYALPAWVTPQQIEAPDKIIEQHELEEVMKKALSTLTDREEEVIRLRFGMSDGLPRTLEEVGLIFDLTRERIRQIEAKALKKLRHKTRSAKLRDCVDLL